MDSVTMQFYRQRGAMTKLHYDKASAVCYKRG